MPDLTMMINKKILFCFVCALAILINSISANTIISDYGLDTNSNGLYDYLVIGLNLTLPESGEYEIGAELKDAYSNEIEMVGNDEFDLEVGENLIQLYFSGMQIYANGFDGNYILEKFVIEGENNDFEYYWDDTHTTNFYSYEDFDKASAGFTGNFSDYGYDENGNGLYDYLVLEVEVNVNEAGYYGVYAELEELSRGNDLDAEFEGYLGEGLQIIELSFRGIEISGEQMNGPYNLDRIIIRDIKSERIIIGKLYDAYTTAEYNYTDFEKPGLEVIEGFSDYGLDTNDNNLYNYLVIKIPINVTIAGNYRIEAELGNFDGEINEERYFETSDKFIYLNFNGTEIYEEKENGSYEFNDFRIEQEDFAIYKIREAYITSNYSYDEFEHEGASIIELIYPENNYETKTKSSSYKIDFNFKVSDESEITYCELIIDGNVEDTKTNIQKDIEQSFNSISLTRGDYNWRIKCVNSDEIVGYSETRYLEIKKKSSPSSSSSSSSKTSAVTDPDFIYYLPTQTSTTTKVADDQNLIELGCVAENSKIGGEIKIGPIGLLTIFTLLIFGSLLLILIVFYIKKK